MQDYWNDPPDYPEQPEWYMMLDDAMENDDMPESIRLSIAKLLEDWCNETNKQYDIEPT